jgi:Contractile injection system spike tip protein
MGDFIIRTGDLLKVTIPLAVVPPLQVPVPLVGSGTNVLVQARPVCLPGDELPAALAGPLPYTAPPFITPGIGTLTLLAPNVTTQTSSGGRPILIKGQPFGAQFTVEEPATLDTPDGPLPDPVGVKPGTAEFITTNATVTAS